MLMGIINNTYTVCAMLTQSKPQFNFQGAKVEYWSFTSTPHCTLTGLGLMGDI